MDNETIIKEKFINFIIVTKSMNIILPNTYVQTNDKSLIFLLGPIRSAPSWQDDAIEFIMSYNKDILIANPRRNVNASLQKYVIRGVQTHFDRQRAWEWEYQDIAARNGVLMFWFPKEANHHCDKSYGLMTSNEFGHRTAVKMFDNTVRLAIGTDTQFNEWDTFAYDLRRKLPSLYVENTLEDTCKEALRLIL